MYVIINVCTDGQKDTNPCVRSPAVQSWYKCDKNGTEAQGGILAKTILGGGLAHINFSMKIISASRRVHFIGCH